MMDYKTVKSEEIGARVEELVEKYRLSESPSWDDIDRVAKEEDISAILVVRGQNFDTARLYMGGPWGYNPKDGFVGTIGDMSSMDDSVYFFGRVAEDLNGMEDIYMPLSGDFIKKSVSGSAPVSWSDFSSMRLPFRLSKNVYNLVPDGIPSGIRNTRKGESCGAVYCLALAEALEHWKNR